MPSHWVWRDGPVATGAAVVVDVDGVVSDASKRQHLLERPMPDWTAFFAACGGDDPIAESFELVRLLDPALTVILLTARPVRVRPQTLDWLARHPLRWDLLVMRPDDDWMGSHTFKRAEVAELTDRGFAIELAFDDDPRNVEMYRQAGVPALYVHSGYYD